MSTVPVTIWYLEMNERAAFRPSGRPAAFTLERLTVAAPEFLSFLYQAVGGAYHWVDRLPWSPEDWLRRFNDPAVEYWVAYDGGAPAGYIELARLADERGTVNLAYLGLLPHAVGQGHGGPLLTAAIERAWAMGARRVDVNTCSLDHPAALANYQARGFTIFREETVAREALWG
jgi:GNAT superfamily N-acetyltransferase